jgi:hypothetical protein
MNYDREVLVRVLIQHQRKDLDVACLCGWGEWGASFAAHVADMYEEAANRDRHSQAAPAPEVKPDHPAVDRAELVLLASGYTPNEDLVDASEWSARSVAEIVLSVLEEE